MSCSLTLQFRNQPAKLVPTNGLALLRKGLSPCRVLEQRGVDGVCRQMHVPHNAAADENVAHSTEMRVVCFVERRNVVELEVEVLVDGFERAADREVVLELEKMISKMKNPKKNNSRRSSSGSNNL